MSMNVFNVFNGFPVSTNAASRGTFHYYFFCEFLSSICENGTEKSFGRGSGEICEVESNEIASGKEWT